MLRLISACTLCGIASMSVAASSVYTVQFMVNARIENGCALSSVSQNLNFSPVSALSQDKLAASIENSAQNWNIRCTANLPVNIQLDGGENYANTRRMKHQSSADYIAYRLYRDQTHNTEYLSGQNITLTTSSTSQLLSFAVYAIADLNNNRQKRPSGVYNDRVAITISW